MDGTGPDAPEAVFTAHRGRLVGVDGRQGFDLVDVHPGGLVHTHIPLGAPPVVSGFGAAVEDALALIEQVKPRRAVLTNMHTDLDYETLRADLPPTIVPAFDGMRIVAEQGSWQL